MFDARHQPPQTGWPTCRSLRPLENCTRMHNQNLIKLATQTDATNFKGGRAWLRDCPLSFNPGFAWVATWGTQNIVHLATPCRCWHGQNQKHASNARLKGPSIMIVQATHDEASIVAGNIFQWCGRAMIALWHRVGGSEVTAQNYKQHL